MKLPWFKSLRRPKKNDKLPSYTPQSAPITNGILRNGSSRPSQSDNASNQKANRHVSFSFQRLGNAQMDDTSNSCKVPQEKRRAEKGDHDVTISEHDTTMNGGNSTTIGSLSSQEDGESEFFSRTRNGCSMPIIFEPDKSCSIHSVEITGRRLSELPKMLASGYGKWESNETIDTADSSVQSIERPRRPLSDLLDEKIAAKLRRQQSQEEQDKTMVINS